MRKVDIKALIQGASASLDIRMEFTNPLKNPLEVSYFMQMDKDTIFSGLKSKVDDKEVEAEIEKREKAAQKYDDAVASGHSAVIAEQSKTKDEEYGIKLGNLLPGSTCTLTLKLIKKLDVIGSSYHLNIPQSFYPDYKKHGLGDAQASYEFCMSAKVVSNSKITYLSAPLNSIVDRNENTYEITCTKASRALDFYYQTTNMLFPSLTYAEWPQNMDSKMKPEAGQVACQLSFVPTFAAMNP